MDQTYNKQHEKQEPIKNFCHLIWHQTHPTIFKYIFHLSTMFSVPRALSNGH